LGGGMFAGVIDERAISVDAEADSWQDAVGLCGSLLVESGVAEERYVPAMIRTVEELGPYVVIAPGVAIPHARPEDGARKPGISLVILQEPVEFGSEENDPVDLLFGFATTGSDAHVEIIRALAEFIGEQENLEKLRQARTEGDALDVLTGGASPG
jgi:mannitol/fructose-specific phosphotransferase system IIA component (Ntr-type)